MCRIYQMVQQTINKIMLENQTVEYYFKQMNCSQKMKFKRNFIEYQKRTYQKSFDFIMSQKLPNFEAFVKSSFIFSDTKEGFCYWNYLTNKII